MARQKKKNKFVGFWAAVLLHFFSRKKHLIIGQDLKKAEFKTDSRAIGVNFNDKIRRIFRPKWLKKHTQSK